MTEQTPEPKKMGIAVNFSKAFSSMTSITLVTIFSFFATNLYWNWKFDQKFDELLKLVFVVNDTSTVTAVLSPNQTPSVYEARNLVKNFMSLMFSYNAQTFHDNIDRAFHYINRGDGLAIYQTFRAGKVLESYTRYNIRSELLIDSLHVNVSTEPYTGVVYTTQKLIFPDEVQWKGIAAKFDIIKTNRSEENPFGLMIRNFNFIEYEPKARDKYESPTANTP